KPMVEIGGKPILWHVMKIYSAHGIHEFVICLGYKGYLIKEYFANYCLHMSDVTLDIVNNRIDIHPHTAHPWRVTTGHTGDATMAAGSMRAFSYCPPRSPITSRGTTRSGSGGRWSSWRGIDSWRCTITGRSGNRWTPCATRTTWTICGTRARPPGRCGHEPCLL